MASSFDPTKNRMKPKTVIATIAGVLALHGVIGVGLMNIPTINIKPPTITPPLEISFIEPPKQVEPAPIAKLEPTPVLKENITSKPVPDPVSKTEPKPVRQSPPQPQLEPQPKLKTTRKPIIKQVETVVQPDPEPIKPIIKPATIPSEQQNPVKPVENQPEPFAHAAQQVDQQVMVAQKARDEQEKAANSQPIRFGDGDAQWRSKPNLNFSGNLARIITDENLSSIGVRINVSSSGTVNSVTITRSSGNSQVDNAVRQRLQSAKLKPFTRNGVAVAGVGNLTVNLN